MKNDDIAQFQRTLFEFTPEKLKKRPTKQAEIRTAIPLGWQLEPHVCKHCFGRVASIGQPSSDGANRYRCTNCGAEGLGRSSSVICSCGIKLHSSAEGKRVGPANRDAGIRCIANPKKSPEHPSEYVAAYVDPRANKP